MRKLCFAVVCLFLLLGSTSDSYAQFNRKSIKKNNHRIASFRGKKHGFGRNNVYSGIGFSVNALNYFGDLSPLPSKFSTDISFTNPGFGLSLFHRFGPRYTLQIQYMYGTLKGSDKESAGKSGDPSFRNQRNLSFRNHIHELSAVAYFDLFENQSTYISRVKWTPYVYLGIAGFYHNPQAQLTTSSDWVDLQPLGTEGQYSDLKPGDANYGIKPYSLLQVAIPFGIGARFRINEVMDLWADIGFRYTFTDYLDDVSANYVDLGVLKSDLARSFSYRSGELKPTDLRPGVVAETYLSAGDGKTYSTIPGYGRENPENIRGNKSQNDVYMVTSIKLTYILGKTFHKAKFR
jgi:Domain of unknown function (DUF6089)